MSLGDGVVTIFTTDHRPCLRAVFVMQSLQIEGEREGGRVKNSVVICLTHVSILTSSLSGIIIRVQHTILLLCIVNNGELKGY